MKNFRTFDLAVEFYRLTLSLTMKGHLKEQLNRAASSVALNLAEGRGRASAKDQARFFQIAFGSVRECQAILQLAEVDTTAVGKLDFLAANLFRLIQRAGG